MNVKKAISNFITGFVVFISACVCRYIIFESILKASKKLKINRNLIEQCCNNKRETAGGYHWEVML